MTVAVHFYNSEFDSCKIFTTKEDAQERSELA